METINHMEKIDVCNRLITNVTYDDIKQFDLKYRRILEILSLVTITGYMVRYYQLHMKNGYVYETNMVTIWTIMLSFWNLISNVLVGKLIWDGQCISSYQQVQNDTLLNRQFLKTDLKMFTFILLGFVLFGNFIASVFAMNKLLYIKNKNEDLEKADEFVPNYSYNISFHAVFKFIAIFVATLPLVTILLPQRLMINSSAIIYDLDTITFKFDHLFWVLHMMFLLTTIRQFINNYQNEIPKVFLLVIYSSCIYNLVILMTSSVSLILFHDILINSFTRMKDIILGNNLYNEAAINKEINILTSVALNYLNHILKFDYGDGTIPSLVASFTDKFLFLKTILVNCLVILNLWSLVFIPFFIWVLLIEIKLNRRRHL